MSPPPGFEGRCAAGDAVTASALDGLDVDTSALDALIFDTAHLHLTALDPSTLDPPTMDISTLDPPTMNLSTLDPPTMDPSTLDLSTIDSPTKAVNLGDYNYNLQCAGWIENPVFNESGEALSNWESADVPGISVSWNFTEERFDLSCVAISTVDEVDDSEEMINYEEEYVPVALVYESSIFV